MLFVRHDIIFYIIYYICFLKFIQAEMCHSGLANFNNSKSTLKECQFVYNNTINNNKDSEEISETVSSEDISDLKFPLQTDTMEEVLGLNMKHNKKYDLKNVHKRSIDNNSLYNESDREISLGNNISVDLNCSNDYCISDEDYLNMIDEHLFPTSYEWVLVCLHSLVFIIGLVGNALVCVAVYRNHSMRTVTNYFIVNLAVADFMVILFCLPPTVLWDVTETWFMGEAMCKIVLYLQTVSVTVSVLTLTFISIDRWYAICFPLKFKSTTSRAKKAILIIWLLALTFGLGCLNSTSLVVGITLALVTLGRHDICGAKHLGTVGSMHGMLYIPELIVLTIRKRLDRIDTPYFTQCEASWSSDSDTTWSVVKLVLLYALPLVFMSVAYFQIVCVLWKSDNVSGRVMAGSAGLSNHRQTDMFTMNSNASTEGQLRSRRKAAKMLVAVVVMFAVCYFPVHLFSVMRITMELPQNDMNAALALLSHWMCYANSAVNPVIYNFMSGKFRKEFHNTFGCSYCCKKKNLGRHQRNMTRSSTYVYRFTHGGSTIARTEIMPLSQLHTHHNQQEHFQQDHHSHTHPHTANNNQCYILHELDQYMHSTC